MNALKKIDIFSFCNPLSFNKSDRKVTIGQKCNFLTDISKPHSFAARTKTNTMMKQIEKSATGANFSAIRIGKLNELGEYVLELGPEIRIPGKVFGGSAVNATGGEFSFQVFQPGTETGFLHTHKTHEELYFFLHGSGEFQVDGQIFPVTEGSVVRVAPTGRRSVRNNGTEPLTMLCVQYRGAAFTTEDAADGQILADSVEW